MWQIKGSTWSYCLQMCTYDSFRSLINSPRFVLIQILVSVDTLCFFICCPLLLFLQFLSPRKKWFELIGTTCFVYLNNNFIWSYWVLFLSINYSFENLFTFGIVTIGELPPVPPLWLLHQKALSVHNQSLTLPVYTTPISSIAGTELCMLHQSCRSSLPLLVHLPLSCY